MHSVAWWPTLIVLAVAVITDLHSRRIPNWLVFPFMLAGIVTSGWFHGWYGIGQSFAGLGLGGLLLGILFCVGGMGMGDVKLCAALGAWIGPTQLLFALVLTGITGGIMAFCWALCGGFAGDLFEGAGDLLIGLRRRGMRSHPQLVITIPPMRTMPYAPAIAIGTVLSFFSH